MLNKLTWLEFLEFFCRIAHLRFVNSEMEGLTLGEKVGYLMDDVFYAVLGVQRLTNIEHEVVSESDDDY